MNDGKSPLRVRARISSQFSRPETLRFECTRCAACCRRRGKYAYVYLNNEEVQMLARHLGFSRSAFERRHTFVDELGWRQLRFLTDSCPFLDQESGLCTVYDARPSQCRTFPFWPELIDGTGWKEEATRLCEGVGKGRQYRPAEVRQRLRGFEAADQA